MNEQLETGLSDRVPWEARNREDRRRLEELEKEIEEHRRWLREDPLLQPRPSKAA